MYEKDNEGYTLDRDMSTHIIASVEKALDRRGVTDALTALGTALSGIQSTLNSIDTSLKSIDSKTKDENAAE